MKKILAVWFGFFFVIALVACSASNETSETPIPLQPTDTASAVPAWTAFITPTMHVPQEATTTPLALFYDPNYEDCSQGWSSSVLGNWALCDSTVDPISIINTSNMIWQFSYKSYYGTEVPSPCTRLQHLTNDENYIYFSLDWDCILTEPGFVSSRSVFRMNLVNGEVDEILKASYSSDANEGNSYSASISPTGRRMAYILHKDPPLLLNILDLQTGENHSFHLDEKYTDGGYYSWSDDGTRLAFMLLSEANYEYFVSMAFLDLLKEDSIVTFIRDKEYSWITAKIEIVNDGVKITPQDGDALFYELKTGVLSSMGQ